MPLSKNDYNIIITKIALTEDTNRRPGNEAKDSVRVSLPRSGQTENVTSGHSDCDITMLLGISDRHDPLLMKLDIRLILKTGAIATIFFFKKFFFLIVSNRRYQHDRSVERSLRTLLTFFRSH